MMDMLKGVVEGTYGEGSEFKFKVDGVWFSNKFKSVPETLRKGSVVEIGYINNDKFKGQFWKTLSVLAEESAPAAPALAASGQAPSDTLPHYTVARGYMTKVQQFPVPVDHPDTTIIRQNALTNAVKWSGGNTTGVENIIRVAREFEAYTSGQLDKEEQERAKAEMDAGFVPE